MTKTAMSKHLVTALALAASTSCALAEGHVYGAFPELYKQECASCHTAYPPELMTASGWKQLMGQLDRHFNADASLDAKTRVSIAGFLAARASGREKHAPTEATGRLTKTAWFVREHGKKASPGTPLSDCAACHTNAENADYSERSLKLPASFRQRD